MSAPPPHRRRPVRCAAVRRHMTTAMNTTTTAKPRSMKLNRPKAELVPAASFARWLELASATPGLTELDRHVLDVIAGYYRLLDQRGSEHEPFPRPEKYSGLNFQQSATFPSIGQMARSAQVRSIDITGAIRNLVGLGLLGVKPGSGARRNTYLLALPRRLVAALSAAAAEDVPPF
jgi:hypothetical protein